MSIAIAYYISCIIASFINPLWGFIGLIGVILLRFPDRYHQLTAYPTTIVIMAFVLISTLGYVKNNQIECNYKQDKYILTFIAIVAFGLLLRSPSDFIKELSILLTSVLFYYFTTRLIRNTKQLLSVLLWTCFFILLLAIEAVHSFYYEVASPFINPETGRMQGLGYYDNANEFGKVMNTAVPFLIAAFIITKKLLVRVILTASIVPLILVLVGANSRTCFVVFAMTTMLILALKKSGGGGGKKVVKVGALVIILIVVMPFLPSSVQQRAGTIGNYSTDKSFQGRVRSWEQGSMMAKSHPILGVGMGQWRRHHGLSSHNSYIQVMAEVGYIGFFIYLSIIWLSIKTLVSVYLKEDPSIYVEQDLRIVGLAVFSGTMGYLVYIFLGNQAYSPWTFFYLGLSSSASCMILKNNASSKDLTKSIPTKNIPQRSHLGRPTKTDMD
jgi:putative inorganic carbon (HCO3(-)) transporter